MQINPSEFKISNVVDTCAVWHILSSNILYYKAKAANCAFCITYFVNYECLYKPRKEKSGKDEELISRLKFAQAKRQFSAYELDIEDLQEVEILRRRKNLGKGELTSIAFAKKTNIAFLTDDQKARKLANSVLGQEQVQTTPHLLSWLTFKGDIGDSDKNDIKKEHHDMGQKLGPHLENGFCEAMRCRLMAR